MSWQHNYFMVEQYILTTHCLVGSGESHCLVVLFNAEGNVPWGNLNQCCSKKMIMLKKMLNWPKIVNSISTKVLL